MNRTLSVLVALVVLFAGQQAFAQNLRADYKSGPVQYQPEDPWVRGRVFQTHTGHGGWFYNCDHQEDKRFSPYINWNRQPCCRGPKCPIRYDINQQLDEVKRRICWGKGDCCHKTDRIPPSSEYVHPVVEEYDIQTNEGEYIDGPIVDGPTTDGTIIDRSNYNQTNLTNPNLSSNNRTNLRANQVRHNRQPNVTRSTIRTWSNPASRKTNHRQNDSSSGNSYLVDDPIGSRK